MHHNRRRYENVVPLARCVMGIAVVLFISAAGIFYVWSRNQIDSAGREIKALEHRLGELRKEQEAVRGKIARLSSIDTLQQSYANGLIRLEPISQYEPAYRRETPERDEMRPVSNRSTRP